MFNIIWTHLCCWLGCWTLNVGCWGVVWAHLHYWVGVVLSVGCWWCCGGGQRLVHCTTCTTCNTKRKDLINKYKNIKKKHLPGTQMMFNIIWTHSCCCHLLSNKLGVKMLKEIQLINIKTKKKDLPGAQMMTNIIWAHSHCQVTSWVLNPGAQTMSNIIWTQLVLLSWVLCWMLGVEVALSAGGGHSSWCGSEKKNDWLVNNSNVTFFESSGSTY